MTPADAAPEPQGRGLAEAAEWIRRARAGEDRAFAQIVERHERMVLRTALALLGRLDDAQEAAQDAFLRLHKYLDRFDETRELGPWLYRVVVNVCHDLARRRAARRLVPLDEASPGDHAGLRLGPETLEDGVSRAQQRRLVQDALATLPPKERAVIVLRDIEGLTTTEVARILGSSEGTVRSQACTARLKIKAFVEGRLKP